MFGRDWCLMTQEGTTWCNLDRRAIGHIFVAIIMEIIV